MKLKNIWIFNHYATNMFKDRGGRHYNFAKNLIERGYDVTIFCASTIHNSSESVDLGKNRYLIKSVDGIKFVFVKTSTYVGNGKQRIKNMIDFYRNLFSVSKKCAKLNRKPDVIIASSVHPLTLVAGIKISKKFHISCICEMRDLWPLTLVEMGAISDNGVIAKGMYSLEKWIYKNANSLIFTGEGEVGYIKDKKWDNVIDLSKVFYINNGIDLEMFNYNAKNEMYDDDDLNNKSFKVMYTGSMGIANSLNYLLQAAEIINNKGIKNITFLLYGDGYQREELEQHVNLNNIQNVRFKGKIEKKYIPYVLSKSTLNVFTGKHIDLYKYGLSLNKMFDYMASGKPILSNIECGYDMLEQYRCGTTVKGGSAEALAEGILSFYNMPEVEYNSYCENALNAAKDFDFKMLTDKLEKVIINTMEMNHENTTY